MSRQTRMQTKLKFRLYFLIHFSLFFIFTTWSMTFASLIPTDPHSSSASECRTRLEEEEKWTSPWCWSGDQPSTGMGGGHAFM